MSKYNDEIFKTLTSTEENFRSSIEVANHIGRVKKKLIKDYWNLVKLELDSLINSSSEDFKVLIHEEIFTEDSKCSLIIKNKNSARFQFEQLSKKQTFGLWIDFEKLEASKGDVFDAYKNKYEQSFPGYKSNGWWFAYRELEDDFSKADSLTQILPNKMHDYSKKRAKELFDFAVKNKEYLTYILENCF